MIADNDKQECDGEIAFYHLTDGLVNWKNKISLWGQMHVVRNPKF